LTRFGLLCPFQPFSGIKSAFKKIDAWTIIYQINNIGAISASSQAKRPELTRYVIKISATNAGVWL
jgi:hypothetical protein